jgi:hypothetical protein
VTDLWLLTMLKTGDENKWFVYNPVAVFDDLDTAKEWAMNAAGNEEYRPLEDWHKDGDGDLWRRRVIAHDEYAHTLQLHPIRFHRKEELP